MKRFSKPLLAVVLALPLTIGAATAVAATSSSPAAPSAPAAPAAAAVPVDLLGSGGGGLIGVCVHDCTGVSGSLVTVCLWNCPQPTGAPSAREE